MLNRQVKVVLSSGDHAVLTRLARRDRQAKSALVRRIVLAETRHWERAGLHPRSIGDGRTLPDAEAAMHASIKVWFADADFRLVERLAEFHGSTVAACVREIVRNYGRRVLSNVRVRS
jgi:hypothetical protein